MTFSGADCYSCWYFIRVDLPSPEATEYRIAVKQSRQLDGAWAPLTLGTPQEQFIRGREFRKARFSLDSMASWSLEAEINAGDVAVYVGLDPDTLNEENYIWSTAGSAGETATLRVR